MTLLYLAPHLSTGGMPQFLLKRIECLSEYFNIIVVEYNNYSDEYVVQKNQIKNLVSHFYTLGENKSELFDIINTHKADVIHIEEIVESFMSRDLIDKLYSPHRSWRIIETCHNVSFKPEDKTVYPEAYAFCTPYHSITFKDNISLYKEVIQYPIENKTCINKKEARKLLGFDEDFKHVVNVGLWTPGKNQKEAVDLARKMPDVQFHFVGNNAPNFRDYWYDIFLDLPKNCIIWGERKDVDVFMKASDVFMFNSVWECNPLVVREAIGTGCKILARNLPQYVGMFDEYIVPIGKDLKKQLEKLLTSKLTYPIPMGQKENFTNAHIHLYNKVVIAPLQKQKVTISHNFVNGPFVEIKGLTDSVYTVCFHDEEDRLIYKTDLKTNHWARASRQWFTNWKLRVWENGVMIKGVKLSLKGRRVYIAFGSSSLGDSIAWMPYCLEFKKKHNCHVVVSTFHNNLFEEVYPELEFVKPGDVVNNIYAQYNIGWFYDANKEPVLPNTVPLQKAATNILGLEYKEIKPRIAIRTHIKPEKKYVTIATNSTAGCKFWTKEGWQEVINYLVNNGYEVINVSKERNSFDNCTQLEDTSIENTISHIYYSEYFIGLSSGLAWMAWGLGKQVVMISNFTEKDHEFECIRVTDESLCHGCWNKTEFKFDRGDWDWCPLHKNTPRHFECHRGIPASKVIDKLKEIGY